MNPHSNLGGRGSLPSLEVQKLTRPYQGIRGSVGAPAGWLQDQVLNAESRGQGKGRASRMRTTGQQQGKRWEGVCAQADPTRAQALGQMGERGKGHERIIFPWSPPQVMNRASGERLKASSRRQTDKTKQRNQHSAHLQDPQCIQTWASSRGPQPDLKHPSFPEI